LLAGSAAAALLATPAPQRGPDGLIAQQGSTEPAAALTDPSGAALTAVAFRSDSDVVAIDSGGRAYEWNLADSYPEAAATAVTAASALTARASAISPDGRLDATAGSLSGGIQVMNVAAGKVAFTLSSPGGSYAQALAFSPDGTELAAAYPSGTIYIWTVPR
ncbi:MAG TPA: WD40 repeat domain-containing protein, partial [Trebonia sp.]|nr:WD40 repeat domain-containing protein [Trebonia sp.]